MDVNYRFGETTGLTFEAALLRVTEELGKEGFGVLTEIDVAGTMKRKLNVDMPPYRILGACNPQLAHRALSVEPQMGLLLPCNVVVRQNGAGMVRVDFMDPSPRPDTSWEQNADLYSARNPLAFSRWPQAGGGRPRSATVVIWKEDGGKVGT